MVQLLPSAETWIWKAFAYAASHCSTTWLIVAVAPRSTCSHCGSLNWLDQRVPVLPSTAAAAGTPPFSVDDAVAGLPCESRVTAAWADCMGTTVTSDASRAAAASPATLERLGRLWPMDVIESPGGWGLAAPGPVRRAGTDGSVPRGR